MTRPRQADVTTFRFVQSLCRILAVASCAVALAQAGCGLHPATESRSIPRRRYRPLGGAWDRSLGGRRHRRGATLQLRTPRRGDDMVSSQRWRPPRIARVAQREPVGRRGVSSVVTARDDPPRIGAYAAGVAEPWPGSPPTNGSQEASHSCRASSTATGGLGSACARLAPDQEFRRRRPRSGTSNLRRSRRRRAPTPAHRYRPGRPRRASRRPNCLHTVQPTTLPRACTQPQHPAAGLASPTPPPSRQLPRRLRAPCRP